MRQGLSKVKGFMQGREARKEVKKHMQEKVQQLRDAVLGRTDREVEIAPNGDVRERGVEQTEQGDKPRATKLTARTFGK